MFACYKFAELLSFYGNITITVSVNIQTWCPNAMEKQEEW